jgi:hypothetical protein
MKPGSKGG